MLFAMLHGIVVLYLNKAAKCTVLYLLYFCAIFKNVFEQTVTSVDRFLLRIKFCCDSFTSLLAWFMA